MFRLKEFRLIKNIIPNTLFPRIGTIVRAIAAICNAFRNPLREKVGERDESDFEYLIKSNFSYNPLKELADSDALSRGWHR